MSEKLAKTVCPKCDGKKRINAFSHISGGVCFCCSGNGFLIVPDGDVPKCSEAAAKKADWVLKATAADWEKLSLEKLSKARDFCHWPLPGYPGLYAAWVASGEDVFLRKQSEWRNSHKHLWAV